MKPCDLEAAGALIGVEIATQSSLDLAPSLTQRITQAIAKKKKQAGGPIPKNAPGASPAPDAPAEPMAPTPAAKPKADTKETLKPTSTGPLTPAPGDDDKEIHPQSDMTDGQKATLTNVVSGMKPDERKAFDAAYEKQKAGGFDGAPEDFLIDQFSRYKNEDENSSTASTWLSGDTMTGMDNLMKDVRQSKREAAGATTTDPAADQQTGGGEDWRRRAWVTRKKNAKRGKGGLKAAVTRA
jgi:hypothetical protein